MCKHKRLIARFTKAITLFLFVMFVFTSNIAYASQYFRHCTHGQYLVGHLHRILSCAQKELLPKTSKKDLELIGQYKTDSYTEFTYRYHSIKWPYLALQKNVDSISPDEWTQRLTIYIPNKKEAQHQTALLYISGGINHPLDTTDRLLPDVMVNELVKQHIVIVLQDIPNQYLTIAGQQKKEDAIIAYTWQRFIQKPNVYTYYPLHIPMTVATRQAMTVAQHVLYKQGYHIHHFVVMGLSKRGWTTWLTGLADSRVVAIMPIVIDILNTSKQIPHIYTVYGQHWPLALTDYYNANITKYAQPDNPLHANYLKLLQVEDPFTYLSNKHYREKLRKIKKYIVNASGDDFFTPDASQFYYEKLPGPKALLYVPNSPHHIQSSNEAPEVSKSLLAFYNRVINHHDFPKITWTHDNYSIMAKSSELPVKATLWVAKNKITRDMRLACGISYQAHALTMHGKSVTANIKPPKKGWQATFIVLRFKDNLLESTPIFITPNTFPTSQQVMPQQGGCRVIG